jgi:hypothetical protein
MTLAPPRRTLAARVRDGFPLTLTGAFVLAGAVWALLGYGVKRIDLVLLVVGAVGLLACTLGFVSTLATAHVVRSRLRGTAASGERLDIECGQPVPTRFAIALPWWLVLGDVHWSWISPAVALELHAGEGGLRERVVALRRGAVEVVARRIVVGDALGLWRIAWLHRLPCSLRFLPSIGALKRVEIVRGMTGGEDISDPRGPAQGDLYDLRHYNPGDPIRYVLWNLFARFRKLVVRQPERAISLVRRTTAYLVAAPGDEAAAAVARLAVEQGALGEGWTLGADGVERPATNVRDAIDLVARSAQSTVPPGAGLAAFLARAKRTSAGRIVVFLPGRPGPWIEEFQRACAPHRRDVDAFVGIDGVLDARGLRARGRDDATSSAAELGRILAAVGTACASVQVFDRSAGRVYGDGHVARWAGT